MVSSLPSSPYALAGAADAAPGTSGDGVRILHRGAPDIVLPFKSSGGEVELALTSSAPGVDWARPGDESAVVSLYADWKYATDLVIPFATPIRRALVLARLPAGQHKLRLHFAADRSASAADTAVLSGLRFTTYAPGDQGYLAAKFTPVLHGRNLAAFGGPLTGVTRAFFLDTHYLPEQSFLSWQGSITLTAAAPSAVLSPAT
ncbi:MAG TPA: hypothetical protein VE442_11895 [Jatrophihabitans sp.]|nr:hypothetical protein [Jatrophihabitans sp.]